MPDRVKEKLSDLLYEASRKADAERYVFDQIADHLIANGVTVQEWIPVAEELPALHIDKYEEPDGSWMQVDVSGFQWVITASGHQTKARYETGPLFQGWVGEDSRTVRDVTHWMPLPEPPKGVPDG